VEVATLATNTPYNHAFFSVAGLIVDISLNNELFSCIATVGEVKAIKGHWTVAKYELLILLDRHPLLMTAISTKVNPILGKTPSNLSTSSRVANCMVGNLTFEPSNAVLRSR
jgi:hypothetical protein